MILLQWGLPGRPPALHNGKLGIEALTHFCQPCSERDRYNAPSLINPFWSHQDGTRPCSEEGYEAFKAYLAGSPTVQAYIRSMPADAVLGCYCARDDTWCHAKIIMEYWRSCHGYPKLIEEALPPCP